MKKVTKTALFLLSMLSTSAFAADVPSPQVWQIVPAQSHITFTATQNNAPVTGEFTHFTGEIQFDPNTLSQDHVTITVDMNALKTSYDEIANTLKTTDWFNPEQFPKAIFKADNFVKLADNQYQAKGTLTIRDKTLPVLLNFSLTAYTLTQAIVHGSATISRTAFGVGQGQSADASSIKDNVTINFILTTIA